MLRGQKIDTRTYEYDQNILKKQDVKMWTGCIYLRTDPIAGSCEHGYEPSVSIKSWEHF
jgi:hypothetical protein